MNAVKAFGRRVLLRFFVFAFLLVSSGFNAFTMRKSVEVQPAIVKVAVMAGPTAFSVAGLNEPTYEIEILKSPADAVARLLSGETDLAILPSHLCFLLLQKDSDIRILAVTGEGALSVIADPKRFGLPDDKGNGKVLHVPAKGSVPDFLAGYLYPEYERDYSYSSPVQLASMLAQGKASAAILPEPYASASLKKGNGLEIIRDVQEDFMKKTGVRGYPMSILVSRKAFLADEMRMKRVMQDFSSSYRHALDDPDATAKWVSDFGFITFQEAYDTIAKSGICFKTGAQAKEECDFLYGIARNANPDSLVKANIDDSYFIVRL